ncbi:IMEF encapsulin system ferritin-like cargo protein [Alkalihalobacillus sp. BA299]|uniref:IMEF encapsulin system ferritin-like cargo protein n=1 Tax=Alkalihalobacillus sp. BA299 TaxID=2815938 RepID=UPI001ADCB7DB|nr:IMEF encapsulin system ferritin-like cargo protein [Alkalihalobacillus sp. BA299]
MSEHFIELNEMFQRTKDGIHNFMNILTPRIENAKDDHERLYYHHIYEEEEQRLDRLNALIPKIEYFLEHNVPKTAENTDFIRLLQDISLEKFGLHNFLEHLDLSLFSFKDTEYAEQLHQMRNITDNDYQSIKGILNDLNQQFDGAASAAGSIPTDEKENVHDNLKIEKYTNTKAEPHSHQPSQPVKENKTLKRLTVGSLKEN